MGQARSYALLLGVRYSIVAAQEGFWITTYKDGYNEVIQKCNWEELKDDDMFFELKKLLGKNA